MPDSQTEIEAPSSGVEVTDVKPATESSTAESSTETKGVENKSLLETVKEALAGSEKSPDSETVTPDPKTGTVAKAAGENAELEDGEEVPADEMKQYSRGAQYRIRQLSAQRKAETERVRELEPKAQVFEQMTSVMQRNGLSGEDVDSGFEIMAAIKTDGKKALELLAPIVKKLLATTGHQMPDDLKAKVEAGEITEAYARELSVARATASNLSAKVEQDEQSRQQQEQQRQATAVIDTAVKSADAWHAEKARTDPDWHLKQQRVLDGVELQVLKTRRFPATEKEARALFESVLKTVESDLKSFLPKKPSIRPSSGGASPDAKAEPNSMLDAMKQAIGR